MLLLLLFLLLLILLLLCLRKGPARRQSAPGGPRDRDRLLLDVIIHYDRLLRIITMTITVLLHVRLLYGSVIWLLLYVMLLDGSVI